MINIIFLTEMIKIACLSYKILDVNIKKTGRNSTNYRKKTYSPLLNQKIDLIPKQQLNNKCA